MFDFFYNEYLRVFCWRSCRRTDSFSNIINWPLWIVNWISDRALFRMHLLFCLFMDILRKLVKAIVYWKKVFLFQMRLMDCVGKRYNFIERHTAIIIIRNNRITPRMYLEKEQFLYPYYYYTSICPVSIVVEETFDWTFISNIDIINDSKLFYIN